MSGAVPEVPDEGTLDCPVCPRRALGREVERCPSCGTDLTLLRRVRELDTLVAPAPVAAAAALRPRGWSRPALALSMLLLLLVGAYAADLRRRLSAARAEGAPTPSVPAAVASTGSPHPPPSGVASGTVKGAESLAELARGLAAVEGVSVEGRPDAVIVALRSAAFGPGSDVPTEEARRALSLLADRTAGWGPATITVTGHTDATPVGPGGRWRHNWDLGLARSRAAALHLVERHPGACLAVASGGDTPPALSEGGPRRTVVLRISPGCEIGR
jgi:outer membrane protein OmpA-like peptidoglycan-associated protein